jgi:hypothetical protein
MIMYISHIYILTFPGSIWLNPVFYEHNKNTITAIVYDKNDMKKSLISILNDSKENNYENILILKNDKNWENILCKNFDEIIEKYENMIDTKDICIFAQMSVIYGHLLKNKMFDYILCELALNIYSFDEIIKMVIKTNNAERFRVINDMGSDVSIEYNIKQFNILKDASGCTSFGCTSIECTSFGCTSIECTFFENKYKKYISENKLSELEVNILTHILIKIPYNTFRKIYSNDASLNIENYLFLCHNISNYTYSEKLYIKNAGEAHTDFGSIYFNVNFFYKLYPCYAKIKNPYLHFSLHIKNGLIGNNLIFQLVKLYNECLTNYLLLSFHSDISVQMKQISNVNYLKKMKNPIYVVTRTSNRISLFEQCCNALNGQLYVNIVHMVSYDTHISEKYVKKYVSSTDLHCKKLPIDLIKYKTGIHPNKYMDMIYDDILKLEPGWVLTLDDDDILQSPYALYYIVNLMKNQDNLAIWMLHRPDKIIYPKNKNNPVCGEIGSCCYMFHTSKLEKGVWGAKSDGDFAFFKHLFANSKLDDVIYVDYPLTSVNYKHQISGWSAM